MDSQHKTKGDRLQTESERLLQELRAARCTATQTAEQLSKQFANLDDIFSNLDKMAENETRLRAEMAEARRTAEEANAIKNEFLAKMSHEMRTPMNGIFGMMELLNETNLDHNQRDYLKNIKLSAERLMVLVNDVLDFSKIESGNLKLVSEDFCIQDTVEGIVEMFRLPASQKQLNLSWDICDTLPDKLHGDAYRLGQILINLISNAVKFTDHGSIKLQVSCLTQDDEHVYTRFTVADTGIGIAPHMQKLIFESFLQIDSTITKRHDGSGLGLSISAHLAELMGSQIEVKSELGKGSTFWLDLKLEKAIEADSCGPLPGILNENDLDKPDPLDGVRLLLAEDDKINQLLATKILEKMGAKVTVVDNGLEAINEIERSSFDAVLMDLQMPEMDGFGATKMIRDAGMHYSSIPIIAITAYAGDNDRKKCVQAGINGFIVKPIDPQHLLSTILSMVDGFCDSKAAN